MTTSEECQGLVEKLGLQPHPMGIGYFLEKFRADRKVNFCKPTSHAGPRDSSSSIYFLLNGKNVIPWGIMLSDEFFYWHSGGVIKLHLINKEGKYSHHLLGDFLKNPDVEYFTVIPHETWYAVEIHDGGPYVLYSAVVAPGWEQADRREGSKGELIKLFPQHKEKFERLCN